MILFSLFTPGICWLYCWNMDGWILNYTLWCDDSFIFIYQWLAGQICRKNNYTVCKYVLNIDVQRPFLEHLLSPLTQIHVIGQFGHFQQILQFYDLTLDSIDSCFNILYYFGIVYTYLHNSHWCHLLANL